MARGQRGPTLLDSLSLLSRGTVTVSVSGYPLVSIQADNKEMELEVKGVREAGLSLNKLVRLQGGKKSVLQASESIATKLSDLGWKLTLYDSGSKLVSMGHGVSRLTGRMSMNPLRAKKLFDDLR